MSFRGPALVLLLLLGGACAPEGPPPPVASPQAATGTPAAAPTTPPPPTATPGPTPEATTTGCADACDRVVARFDGAAVTEASGLEHGERDPGVIWVLDDGPLGPGLAATSVDQGPLGVVPVAGLSGGDTEALALGPCASGDPDPCLFIGDIGDNLRRRDEVRVLRLPEPDLRRGLPLSPLPADVATFTYPDGPRDAEAMFTHDGRLFLLTKATAEEGGTRPTELFEAARFADGALEPRGPVPVPPPQEPLLAPVVGNVVVGADLGAAGVVLRTYDHALLFRPPTPDADPADFPGWPVVEIPTAGPLQTEAVALPGSDCTHDTAGEQDDGIWRTPCPAELASAP